MLTSDLIGTLAPQGFSLFSAATLSTVPTYADEIASAKCNFLFCSLPACQRRFFDTLKNACINDAGILNLFLDFFQTKLRGNGI